LFERDFKLVPFKKEAVMQMPKIPEWKGVATEEIRVFFLEASAETYAAGAAKLTVPQLPGSKVLYYGSEHIGRTFSYVDCYFSSGRRSFGQTVISVDRIAVWGMQYHGFWESEDERVIPFLKRALLAAYSEKLFLGGRGPRVYRDRETERGLLYCNYPESDDFTNFKGHEEIVDDTNSATLSGFLFRHKYNGLLL